MKKKEIMIVMGTRPEIIKLAPILFELKKFSSLFKVDTVWSGQHLELAAPFLKLFNIKPHISLKIMQKNQSSSDICVRTLGRLEKLINKKRPDILLVQGDTTTAFVAALSAYYNKIPVAHVEAGLRSRNYFQPFPEEKNREMISVLTRWHFAPTQQSRENLLNEGIDPRFIYVVGNSVVDALKWLLKKYPPPKRLGFVPFDPGRERLLVVTAHRRENYGLSLNNICDALLELTKRHRDLKVVFPVHLNPNVRRTVMAKLKGHRRIELIPPLDYISFIHLMTFASVILTDSGGIQEEAPYLGKPALILRDVTERPEGLATGTNFLAGRKTDEIVASVERVLGSAAYHKKTLKRPHPFGRGDTAGKIVKILGKI